MIHIYIAGPYSRGSIALNVRSAIAVADELLDMGFAPYLPHTSHLWELVSPKDYEVWMRLDLAWIARCHGLLRIPGESPGADREVAEARQLGMPVFESVAQLSEHFSVR